MMRHREYERNKESIFHKKSKLISCHFLSFNFLPFSHKFWKENKMRNVFLLNSPMTEGEIQTRSPENSHLMHYKKTSSLPIQYTRQICFKYANQKRLYSLPKLALDHITILRKGFKSEKGVNKKTKPQRIKTKSRGKKKKKQLFSKKDPLIAD